MTNLEYVLGREQTVLDHGTVMLKDFMGGDLRVVEAAKASFKKDVLEMLDHERGVLRFMLEHKHGSPFEHSFFTFVVKCPIFVAREWFRHRMSSFNEWSGRYSKLEPEFYIPAYVRTQVGKPGAYKFEPMTAEATQDAQLLIEMNGLGAYSMYEDMLASGVAKEVARLVLPLNIYTQFYWTVNARSLMNFLSLRNNDNAQWEIRQYAEVIEDEFSLCMPETHQAFNDFGRVAP